MNRILFLVSIFLFGIIAFSQGQSNIQKKYYDSGKLKSLDTCNNNTCSCYEYYESGILYKKGKKINGLKQGLWQTWEYNADITNSQNKDVQFSHNRSLYFNDTLNGYFITYYYDYYKGKPEKYKIYQGMYLKGVKVDEWKRYGIYNNGKDSAINLYLYYKNDILLSKMEWIGQRKEWQYNEIKEDNPFGKMVEYYRNAKVKAEGRVETTKNEFGKDITYKTGIWVLFDTLKKVTHTHFHTGYIPYLESNEYIHTAYYPSKLKKEEGRIIHNNSIKDGLWTYWDSNGTITNQEFYLNGEKTPLLIKDSTITYNYNGFLATVGFASSYRQGKATYKNKNYTIDCAYQSDLLNGKFTVYNLEGVLLLEGQYFKNRKIGTFKYYSKDGKVIREQVFVDGELTKERSE